MIHLILFLNAVPTLYSFVSAVPWLRGRNKRTRVRILCCGVKTLGKFFHSTLLQSTQLYESVPGYRQVVDMCTSSIRALIVAYGWMLPREVEMVFD